MSDPIDWAAAGKAAQALSTEQKAEAVAADAIRVHAESEERSKMLVLSERTWAIIGEIKSACAEIATTYNKHVQDSDLRLNVVGGGIQKFTLVKGRSGLPRLEISSDGADQIHVYHATTYRPMAGGTEVYAVAETGELVVRRGTQIVTPKQIAEDGCKWLASAQSAE